MKKQDTSPEFLLSLSYQNKERPIKASVPLQYPWEDVNPLLPSGPICAAVCAPGGPQKAQHTATCTQPIVTEEMPIWGIRVYPEALDRALKK